MNNIKRLCFSIICYYFDFSETGFNFQLNVCYGCHDVLMMSMNLGDIAILNIRGVDYCSIINGISKSETMALFNPATLNEKN